MWREQVLNNLSFNYNEFGRHSPEGRCMKQAFIKVMI